MKLGKYKLGLIKGVQTNQIIDIIIIDLD